MVEVKLTRLPTVVVCGVMLIWIWFEAEATVSVGWEDASVVNFPPALSYATAKYWTERGALWIVKVNPQLAELRQVCSGGIWALEWISSFVIGRVFSVTVALMVTVWFST